MRKINKRGQILNAVSGVVVGIMVLIFMVFAVLYGISKLNPGSFFSTASAEKNATDTLVSNLTTGVAGFGQYIPVILAVLGVVLALAGIVILVAYVKRMQGGGTGGL